MGDAVRVREWHPFGHTRAPRYVQGKRGVVVRVDGTFNVPDVEAHSDRRVLDPTYSVCFTARELWEMAAPTARPCMSISGTVTSRRIDERSDGTCAPRSGCRPLASS